MSDKEPSNNKNTSPEDDDFGLPEGSFSPLAEDDITKNEEENEVVAPIPVPMGDSPEETSVETSVQEPQNEKSSSSGWVVILLLLLLVTASGIGFYLGWFAPSDGGQVAQDQGKTDESTEQPVISEAPSEVPELPSESEIPTEELKLTEITSKGDSPRYFVVVGSFIDDDLAKDYSKKLNTDGFKTYLIHPYGDIDFYRLAVDEHPGVAEALTVMERIQADFEENLWVLKY